jgi:hypothetical protein
MHGYASRYGRLPPAVVYGEDGKPLLSWRVLLLPDIEQDELYQQFHLDEPWDSPHNIQLLPKMPRTYAPPPRKAHKVPPGHTLCQVFVGKGTPFEPGRVVRFPQDFPNGTSNTFLVVEAGRPVPWTKPEDLPYCPDRPLPNLDGLFKGGFRAGLADGSRRWVATEIPEATLRRVITLDSGLPGPGW